MKRIKTKNCNISLSPPTSSQAQLHSFSFSASPSSLLQAVQRDGKWRLWPVHSTSSLLILPSYTFPLLQQVLSTDSSTLGNIHLVWHVKYSGGCSVGTCSRVWSSSSPASSDFGAFRVLSQIFLFIPHSDRQGFAISKYRHSSLVEGTNWDLQWLFWSQLQLSVSSTE